MLTLSLSLDDVNVVLSALGARPYVDVAEVIGKITQQAREQMADAPAVEAPDSEAE